MAWTICRLLSRTFKSTLFQIIVNTSVQGNKWFEVVVRMPSSAQEAEILMQFSWVMCYTEWPIVAVEKQQINDLLLTANGVCGKTNTTQPNQWKHWKQVKRSRSSTLLKVGHHFRTALLITVHLVFALPLLSWTFSSLWAKSLIQGLIIAEYLSSFNANKP